MANENEAKVLREIAETLSVWQTAVPRGDETDAAQKSYTGIRSLELLRDNDDLVCRCASDYGTKNGECRRALTCLDNILPDIRSGRVDLWYFTKDVNVIAAPGFISELKRWADELDKAGAKHGRGNGKEGDKEQRTPETDTTAVNDERKIELIDDFANWTEKLIDYIKRPDKNREISKTRADTLGDQVNNFAKKIWPQNNFEETGLPYQSTDIPENKILLNGTVLSITSKEKDKIFERLQQWKDLALEDKSKLQEKLEMQRKEATGETAKPKGEPGRDGVFICYSHKDKRWLDDLQTHLKPYVRTGSVTAWSDKQIAPGSRWFPEIKVALASTKVAVLLVTPNFLASDFIHEHELTPLLKEAEKGDVRIIWIPVRACSYKETPLKDYQAATDPDKPLANMKAERDKAWVRICDEIKKACSR